MKFSVTHKLGKEGAWNIFTTENFTNKWLAKESTINWKKNGKLNLIIEPRTHEISRCKILEFQPYDKIEFSWKGPEEFDITMNFEDYLTHVEVIFHDDAITLEHKGWRSSEDWQQAKDWHEKKFWPEKITKLTELFQKA